MSKLENFISKAKEKHNNLYDYSLVQNYKNVHMKVPIICKVHGIFIQRINSHLSGNGCPICKFDEKRLSKKEFIKKSKEIHGDKYDYSLVKYENMTTKVKIICSKHGMFEQSPDNHINRSSGCPICKESHGEKIIRIYLQKNDIFYISQKRFSDCKDKRELPFDFYLPDFNMCIEYDGKQHFDFKCNFNKNNNNYDKMKKHDKIKNNYCNENNINLLRIKYNENILEKLSNYI